MHLLPRHLDADVLKAVRKCEGLQRLVYVSCNQKVLPVDLAQYVTNAAFMSMQASD
jgi:tRNA/tmRNA/rRNA uracil-C5-methylase (TrmA/RlmC/RlmD family)